jgi:integrin beta 3
VLRADISDDQGGFALAAPTAAEAFGLCADERFATQPSAALCSAVLVAPDIALTAGHCLSWMSCARLALVFGYHYRAPDQLRALGVDDVYECSEVLSLEVQDDGESLIDYAFVRLDRPVAPALSPVSLSAAPSPIAGGSVVTVIGHSAGLPTKVARGGRVIDARGEHEDYFRARIDNFVGGSGSGVFDAQARLVGVAARGELDFAEDPAGCRRAVRVAEDAPDRSAGERVIRLDAALAGLCAERPDASPCAARHLAEGASCRALPGSAVGGAATHWPLALFVPVLVLARRLRERSRAFAKRQRALR